MIISLGARSRAIVNETLPLMRDYRPELEAAMARYMSWQRAGSPSPERAGTLAGAIMEMLIEHAAGLDGHDQAESLADAARHLQRLAIATGDYSRFGDGLGAIMKDVLGERASSPMLAAWGSAYWAIVRAIIERQARMAA